MDQIGLVTRKGQVTIPSEMRKRLRLSEGDRVRFRLEDGKMTLEPLRGSVTERTKGIFKRDGPPLTIEEMRELAVEGWLARESERMSE